MSDTTLADDRTRKRRIYARAGVEEYWIVNLAEAQVERHRAPAGEDYEEAEALRPPATLAVPETGAELRVADLLP